ncbi:MAG: FecR domain-containing protein [Planctomycetota bacterium]
MNLPKETAELLEAYFAGDPTPETIAAMEAWLSEDPGHPRLLAEYGLIDRLISHEQKKQDASAIFGALFEAEEEQPLSFIPQPPGFESQSDTDALTKQKYASALSYVLRHTITPKRVAGLAAAAVLLLGVVLAAVMLVGPDGTDQIVAAPSSTNDASEHGTDDAVDPPTQSNPTPSNNVATLTAERNAVWDRRPGRGLYAGQRLTLIEGFAQITTRRGAVAILEAPATVELTSNDNALRLHTGKLIGICETESSKGFLVRTPQMDITDLGTRFGVACGSTSGTFVTVFDGRVQFSTQDELTPPRVLGYAESIAVDAAMRETDDHPLGNGAFGVPADIDPAIAAASGSARYLFAAPAELAHHQYGSDTHVSVLGELRGEVLPGDVQLSFASPGKYDRMLPENIEGAWLGAGTAVNSYVIRARPGTNDSTYEGWLTFETPILGVMILPEDWNSFKTLMPDRAISLAPMPSELLEGMDQHALPDARLADWVRISEDRKTLSFYLFASTTKADHIRVFVEAPVALEPLGL